MESRKWSTLGGIPRGRGIVLGRVSNSCTFQPIVNHQHRHSLEKATAINVRDAMIYGMVGLDSDYSYGYAPWTKPSRSVIQRGQTGTKTPSRGCWTPFRPTIPSGARGAFPFEDGY